MRVAAACQRAVAGLEARLFAPADPRTYAAVRVAQALASMAILVELFPLRAALFTPGGVVPRAQNLPFYLPLRWVDSEAGVTALFVVMGALAVCLLLGLMTRLAALALYLWALSYSLAAYPAESGYDALGRISCLLLLVSPPIRALSLDARLFGQAAAPPRYALLLFRLQLAVMYVATVWLKAPDAYWRRGDAMAYFMMSVFAQHPSAAWASLGRTSVLLTWGTLLLEAGIPLLLFRRRFRRLGLLAGILLHGGIALGSTIGLFSLSLVPYYAAFLTTEDFDLLSRLRRPPPGRSLPGRSSGASAEVA